jgi:hypothetical protein
MGSKLQEKVLGFDFREVWRSSDDLWPLKRREIFLLNLDAAKPLSVDSTVWPSVFDIGQGIGLPQAERQRLGMAGLELPQWIGPNAGLWENLDDMRRYLADRWQDPRPHSSIAITWLSDQEFSDAGQAGPYLEPTSPAGINPDWLFLGFDVADGSLVSGLSNCGYLPDEVARLRSEWWPHVNENHLFRNAATAFKFRELADARVPEHAPFFVYGLYVIEHQNP